METGSMGVNSIVKDLDNVLYIDAVPSEKTVRPPFTLFPLMEKDSDAFQESASTGSAGDIGDEKRPEAFEVVFDEDYDGDLSVKICSLMAEDFQIFIDGDEYSYAVRGAKQTDPGYRGCCHGIRDLFIRSFTRWRAFCLGPGLF